MTQAREESWCCGRRSLSTPSVVCLATPRASPLQLPIDHYITHNLKGLESTNDAIAASSKPDCVRVVVIYEARHRRIRCVPGGFGRASVVSAKVAQQRISGTCLAGEGLPV